MNINERKDAIISYDWSDFIMSQIDYLKENPDEFLEQYSIDAAGMESFEEDKSAYIDWYFEGDEQIEWDWYWDDFLMNLDSEFKGYVGDRVFVEGSNMGWRNRMGVKSFVLDTPEDMFRELVPQNTDVTFYLWKIREGEYEASVSHHDSPMGEHFDIKIMPDYINRIYLENYDGERVGLIKVDKNELGEIEDLYDDDLYNFSFYKDEDEDDEGKYLILKYEYDDSKKEINKNLGKFLKQFPKSEFVDDFKEINAFAKGGVIEEWSIQTDNEDEHFDNEDEATEFWKSLSEKERKSGQYFRKSYFKNEDGELEEDEVEIIEQFAKGGITKPRLKKGDKVDIYGKRWFQKSYGNTYHVTKVYVNGVDIGESDQQYGYDEQYLQTGAKILWNKYKPPYKWNMNNPLWMLRNNGIDIYYNATDVEREKDLWFSSRRFAKGGDLRKYKVGDEFIDEWGSKIIIIGQRLRPSGKPVFEDEWKIERRTDGKGKQRGYRSEKLLMREQQLDTLKSYAKGGRVMSVERLAQKLERAYPNINLREDDDSISIFEEFPTDRRGYEIADYYSEAEDTTFGVKDHFNNFLERNGYWAEWQNPGHLKIWKRDFAKGGLTPEEGEMVEPWMWDYIKNEISYTRKPTSIDEVSASFDAAEVDEEVLQIIGLFPRLEADNLEDLDGVLTGDTQFYVVYINEVPYLINNEGFDYPRYASRIDNLEGTEENWGLIYNPKFKGYAQYAKGGYLKKVKVPKNSPFWKMTENELKKEIIDAYFYKKRFSMHKANNKKSILNNRNFDWKERSKRLEHDSAWWDRERKEVNDKLKQLRKVHMEKFGVVDYIPSGVTGASRGWEYYRLAKGGKITNKKVKELIENHTKAKWRNTDMGSGWEFTLRHPDDNEKLSEKLYLDFYDGEDDEYKEWKEDTLVYTRKEFLEEVMKDKNVIEEFQEFMQKDEDFAKGGKIVPNPYDKYLHDNPYDQYLKARGGKLNKKEDTTALMGGGLAGILLGFFLNK